MKRSVLTLALAVGVAAGAPALAHGPIRKQLRTTPPPGTVVPLSQPPFPADLSPPRTGGGVPTTGVYPLRVLAADASAIVLANVTRTETYDKDRLKLHRLGIERVLRGRLDDPEPGVIDLAGGSHRTSLLVPGQHLVVLLRPAPRLSYLAQQQPEGKYFDTVGGRDGLVLIGSEAELQAVERIFSTAASMATLDAGAALAAQRGLAFDELRSESPRLVADALAELRELPELASLSPKDADTFRRVLPDRRIDPIVRVGLIALLTERAGANALPGLTPVDAREPVVLAALLDARARLGAPADHTELARYLASDDPSVRAAALRALAALGDAESIAELGRHATADADVLVRAAAVEALGASRRPAAVPILARSFDVSERAVQQASGRALLAIGGPAAADTLVDLALKGASSETRTYAALLLIASRGPNDPAVRRIADSNPSPEVRYLLEHGLEFRETDIH